jgi:hypothetical protein
MNMETAKQARSCALDALVRFTEQLHVARATELARSGRLLEAEALLTSDGGPRSGQEMDLLARIAAQRSKFEHAAAWWQAAQEKDPSNADYRQGLEALADEARKQVRNQKGLLWASAALTTILMLVMTVLLWTRPSAPPRKKANTTQSAK